MQFITEQLYGQHVLILIKLQNITTYHTAVVDEVTGSCKCGISGKFHSPVPLKVTRQRQWVVLSVVSTHTVWGY